MPTPPAHAPTLVARRLDQALLAVAAGRRRPILELVRDDPAALPVMAARMRAPQEEVSLDLAAFHATEFETLLEAETARYDEPLLAAAAIGAGDRVLDVGCGSGATSRTAARLAADGAVVGVDVAPALVRRADERARAERLANATFVRGDAATHPFAVASFDVVLSRFGTMYFGHPGPAFAHLRDALRPGGRLALTAWRCLADNEWMGAVAEALGAGPRLRARPSGVPGPFGLAEPDHVRAVLAEAGFADVALARVDEPVCLGPDPEAAYAMLSTQKLTRDLLAGADAAARRRSLGALRALLEARATPTGVLLGGSAWVITAVSIPGRP
ncbi:MAG TPA: class I SAM-dependent methyltransferase [Acidimicrobiales bacterium]|nr:class I SAM-dependent methyltransferase [Acidimicrobiales bacterium]